MTTMAQLFTTKAFAMNIFLVLKILSFAFCEEVGQRDECCLDVQNNSILSRTMRDKETGRGISQNQDYPIEKGKSEKPWFGYYDFLITEGSYKFWVVFQLFTIGVLIYSAFAAIYYAKFTFNDYENYDDYLLGRSTRSIPPVPSTQTAFLGLPVETYLQIFNAIYNYGKK